MKALRRSNTSSSSSWPRAPSSPQTSSWIHLRSLLLAASSSSSSTSLAASGNSAAVASALVAEAPSSPTQASSSPHSERYDLNSSEEERNTIKIKKRNEYEKLRHKCHQILNCNKGIGLKVINESTNEEYSGGAEGSGSPYLEDVSARVSVSPMELKSLGSEANRPENAGHASVVDEDTSELTYVDPCVAESESSDSESSDEEDPSRMSISANMEENCDPDPKFVRSNSSKSDFFRSNITTEDFATWQRIIRLDAIRQTQIGRYSPITRLKSLRRKHCSAQYLLG